MPHRVSMVVTEHRDRIRGTSLQDFRDTVEATKTWRNEVKRVQAVARDMHDGRRYTINIELEQERQASIASRWPDSEETEPAGKIESLREGLQAAFRSSAVASSESMYNAAMAAHDFLRDLRAMNLDVQGVGYFLASPKQAA